MVSAVRHINCLFLFLALVALAVFATIAYQRNTTTKQSLPAANSVQLDTWQQPTPKKDMTAKHVNADVYHEINLLKSAIKRIDNRLAQLVSRMDDLDDPQVFSALPEDPAVQARVADNQAQTEMHRADAEQQIETIFIQQEEDAAWAVQQESAIEQFLGINQNTSASIVDLHCKSTLCRLEFKYDLSATNQTDWADHSSETYSTNVSNLLDAAIRNDIDEANKTGIAVVFLGQIDQATMTQP